MVRALHGREILYAPDFVINAGGLINVYNELERRLQSGARRPHDPRYLFELDASLRDLEA